jgi:tungstate transport system substrate-binding protein
VVVVRDPGPPDDPAGIVDSAFTAPEALKRIAAAGTPFVSRGDDSGTHR